MFNKKGGIDYALSLPVAITVLLIILVIFSITFFAYGLAKSSALVIEGTSYKDSIQLANLLKTEITLDSETLAIADSINLASKNEENSNKVKLEIDKLLNKFPKPNKGTSFWHLTALKNNEKFLDAGDNANLGTDYLTQEISIPLENKEIVFIKLYLSCRSCIKEEIGALS